MNIRVGGNMPEPEHLEPKNLKNWFGKNSLRVFSTGHFVMTPKPEENIGAAHVVLEPDIAKPEGVSMASIMKMASIMNWNRFRYGLMPQVLEATTESTTEESGEQEDKHASKTDALHKFSLPYSLMNALVTQEKVLQEVQGTLKDLVTKVAELQLKVDALANPNRTKAPTD